MKLIRTEDAVGHVICHDITQIIKGVTKDAVFRKGHIVREEDIPVLLSVGKEHLYVWEKQEGMLHEDEAVLLLRDICLGDCLSADDSSTIATEAYLQKHHMRQTEIKEGKLELIADCNGLLKINKQKLNALNAVGELMIATRHGNTAVRAGDKLAGMRVIPLVIEEAKLAHAREVIRKIAEDTDNTDNTEEDTPIVQILPFKSKKVGIVTTGSEVYHGRIKDTFTPVIYEKLSEFDAEVIGQVLCDDNHEKITEAIRQLIDDGADMVVCLGGMSVDPDDRTPLAIKNACKAVVTYGAPVLPGAMFMLAYDENGNPVLGLPGCVMYAKRTIFDLVLPRLMADERLCDKDLSILGEGGLCLSCEVCTFPNCGFGK